MLPKKLQYLPDSVGRFLMIDRIAAGALAQFFSIRGYRHGQMHVTRSHQAQRLLQSNLPKGGVEQIGAPDDLRDTLEMVVNDHGQLIRKQPVSSSDDEIVPAADGWT